MMRLIAITNQKGATIIISNLLFEWWNEIFNDSMLTGAITECLTYKSHLINMSGIAIQS